MKQITIFLESGSLTLMHLVEGSKPLIIYEDPPCIANPPFSNFVHMQPPQASTSTACSFCCLVSLTE